MAHDVSKNIQPEVALAICIVQALHQRDAKFVEVLKATVDEMYDDVPNASEAGKALYAFALALDDKKLFLAA